MITETKRERLTHAKLKVTRNVLLTIESVYGRIEYLPVENIEALLFHVDRIDSIDLNTLSGVDLISFEQ